MNAISVLSCMIIFIPGNVPYDMFADAVMSIYKHYARQSYIAVAAFP